MPLLDQLIPQAWFRNPEHELLCSELIFLDEATGKKVNVNVFVTHIDDCPQPCWPAIQAATQAQCEKLRG